MGKAGEEYPPFQHLGKPDARIGNASNLPVTANQALTLQLSP